MKLASCLNKLKGMFTDAERAALLEAGKGGDGVAVVEAELAIAKSDLDRVLSEISKAQATKSPAKEKEVAPELKRPEGAVAPSALTHAPAVDIHTKADLTSASMAPTNVTAKLLAEPSMTVRDRFGGRQVPKHLVPVYSKAIGAAIKLGMPEHALDGIKHFYVKRKDLGAEYSIEAESIGVSLDILEAAYRGSQIWAATIVGHVIHEVGHHITGDADGTSFVAQSPDFAVRIGQDGKRVAVGVVMREALAARQSDGDLSTFLGYPLRDWGYNDNARPVQDAGLSVAESTMILQEEVFAQAWSLYFTNPDLLQAEMPATFNVMKGVADVVRNGQGIAESRRGVREALRRRVPEVRTEVGRGDRLAVEAGARDGHPDSGMGSGRGDVASRKEARGEPDRDKPAADVRPAREGADEWGAAEGVREDRQRRGSDEVASEDLRGDGRGFTTFFTDATTGGRKPNTGKRFEPVIDISRTDAFSREYEKHRGNFDDHIATSIPGFRETQQAVGNAIVKSLPNGGTVLDIGASEGSFIKAITALSGGKIKTVGLDPNVAMAKFFLEHSSVPGSTYEMAAFGARADEGAHRWDEPDGTPVHIFKPKAKFDIVHEAMTFQFISNSREGQVARVKELMKAGGVALFEQKFIPEHDEFARNEAKKDSYKALYYSAAELDRKKKDVLERGEAAVAKEEKDKEEKVVGMHDLMVSPEKFEKILGDNFAHVVQYWDSGNFKGYAASDNPLALSRLVANIGDLNSEYSTVETPSTVKGPARPKTLDVLLHHGTTQDITNYRIGKNKWGDEDLGIHFGSPEQANKRLSDVRSMGRKGRPRIYIHDVDILNPLRLRDVGNWYSAFAVAEAIEAAGFDGFSKRVLDYESKHQSSDVMPWIRSQIIDAGYDGVVYENEFEGGGDSYIILNPAFIPNPKRPSTLEIKDDSIPERSFDIGAQRGERDLGAARLTKEDHDKIVADGKALSLPPKRVQEFLAEARKTRSRFPPSRGWAPLELVGVRRIDRPTNDGTMAQDVELSWKPIAYGFNVPPGAKRAPVKIDRAWVDKVADKGVGEILSLYERAKTGDPVAKNIVAHASWYRAMAARLREEFGAAGDFFADLLGAFSPNTPVTTNWNFAVDALRAFSHGEYRQQLEAFDNWIQAGNSPSKFPASDKIRQLSGKLFGINSTNGALAMLEMWRNIAPGMAPKARNFSANLIGASNEATIDVWAARFLRRMAGTIRGYSAPRIPVVAENAVTGNWNAGTTRVTGEFGFGQDVMAEMSRRLAKRGIDLTPPDLQAVAWFVEKELWTKNAWTSKQGEGGSFEAEADKWQLRRYFSGLSIQRDAAPEDMAMNVAAARLLSTTNADHRVVAHRALPTLGMYYGSEERSFDDEVVAREGWDPGYWIGEVAAIAKESKQQDAMVTRVVGENEVSTNARPGIEVFFKGPITKMQLESIHKAITEGGEAGFTLTIDPRAARTNAGETPDAFNGLRILYVPEFGLRFGDEGIIAAVRAGTDEAISSIMDEKAGTLRELANTLSMRADVSYVRSGRYDSVVFGKENYDEYTGSGVAQEAVGRSGERVWFGQPVREVLARAARRYGIIEGQDGGADVLQRTADGNGQEEVARRPGSLGVEQGVVERLDEPLWYSRLKEAVQKAPWSKANDMPVGQLRMWIAARTKDGTLPAEEVKWSGLDDYLMGIVVSGSIEDGHNGRVKRADVESFLRQNGVKVEEKMLGERPLPPGVKQITLPTGRVKMEGNGAEAIGKDAVDASILLAARFQRLAQHWQKNGDEEQARRYFIRSDAMVEWSESAEGYGTGGETKFSTYQLPGGKNYKELLLTLPPKSVQQLRRRDDGRWQVLDDNGQPLNGSWDTEEAAREVLADMRDNYTRGPGDRQFTGQKPASFKSGHYGAHPNILAHIRFNERTAADGSRVLFIEEIQSDWAQTGRSEGFGLSNEWRVTDRYGATLRVGNETDVRDFVARMSSAPYNRNPIDLVVGLASTKAGIPSAPFVGKTESWVALAMKRMIRYAADNGFDAIAWTNGEQQADRYDLSKQVREVHWGKGEGGYSLTIKTRSGSMEDIGHSISAEKLQDYVGKDVAQKIVDSTSKSGALSGLDLKVGGEGMRAFYDKIVPNVANNLLKKLGGGRVESVKINVGGPGARVMETSDGRFAVLRGEDNDVERFAVLSTEQEALKVAAGLSASQQPGFHITSEMAPRARRPQALFAKSDVSARNVTDTPEFKRWFGDSKVVDAGGKPLRVYHGTRSDFSTFERVREGTNSNVFGSWKSVRTGIFFADSANFAGEFASQGGGAGSSIIPAYLSIKNPVDLRDGFDNEAMDALTKAGLNSRYYSGLRPWTVWEAFDHENGGDEMVAALEAAGFDGARITDISDSDEHPEQNTASWVAFSPTQIKSAIGNNGNFDPKRPSILEAQTPLRQRASDVTETPEFKAWFGDSKVVDEAGKPLRVYHGTTRWELPDGRQLGDITTFDRMASSTIVRRKAGLDTIGSWFSTEPGKNGASMYANNGAVYPVYLSIQNPYVTTFDMLVQRGHKLAGTPTGDVTENGVELSAAFRVGTKQVDALRAWLKETGRDGIKIVHDPKSQSDEFRHQDAWVALDPTQIKSAIGNNGNFDPKRPSILESRGDLLERAQNLVADTLTTQKSFNLWDRTVGTAFHKAWKDADFKPVYDGVQNYLNDASRMMTEAADLAPDVLPKLEGLRGILGATASKADIESMSSAIFDGTLDDRVYTNAELSQRGLSAKAVELYRQTRAAIDKSLTDLFTSEAVKQAKGLLPPDVLARARDAGDPWLIVDGLSSIPAAQRTPAHQQVYDQLRERLFKIEDLKRQGYAPLMRFGQYTVHLVDQNGGSLSFTMHESEREANAVARAMREAYPQATVSQGVLSQDAWQLFQGVTPDTLEIFAQSLGASDKEIFQKYLHLATNNRSTLKRLIRRKKIPGFSPDAQRALAQFVTSNGRAASRNYHWGDVLKAASAIPKAKGDVKDEAVRLAQYVQHPTEEAGALRGLLFVQFLGGSVASALTNATQPILMSFPYLSRFGAGKAASELVRAAKVAVGGTAPEIDLRDAMNKATHEGIIAPHEVAGLYAESIRNMGSNLVVRRILRAWGSLFSLAEAFNRRITFVAAFRLARDAGEGDPYGFAVNAIAETQGVYNRGNRPNWARGPVGATLMTFKQYSVAYVEFLARLPAKQRAIALATLVLAAGLQGLPGADDLEDVVDTIAESLGYSFNSKKAAREWAIRTLGESAGGVLAGGFSGLPGVPIDVQARLGLGNLIPGTGVFKRSSPDKSRDVLEFFGPAGSQARSVVDAVSAAQEGNPGAVAKSMLPLAVQNALKAVDMASTGFYHDMRGRRVIDVDAYDAAIKGIGIQPKRVADVQRRRMDLQQDISLQRDVESEIADLWARGVYERDPEKVARARAKLLDWNLSNPESRVVITPQQIHKRVQQATLTADQRFLKTAPPELRARVASELLQ